MDTLKSSGSTALNRVASVTGEQPKASGSVGDFVKERASQILGQKEQGGGLVALTNPAQAESAVAANQERTKNTDFNSLGDINQRKAFVQNVSQLDGVQGGRDGQSCGPTSLVAGITMADPKSTQKLADGILNQGSSERKAMFGDNKLSDAEGAALRRIRDGNASPADIQTLAQVMGSSKGVDTSNGSSLDEMGKLVGNATKLMGGKMPNMELHLFADSKDSSQGAHWQAYSNGVEIDPWPNEKGQATLTEGAAGLAQGSQHFPNGTVHSKMIIQNEGQDIVIPRYLGLDSKGARVANADPNQPLTNYHYKQDVFGYGYTRSSGEVPAAVDPNQEPGKEIGQ